MKRTTAFDFAIIAVLIAIGVVARVVFRELPNFKPVAALTLFAGFYFASCRSRWMGISVAALVPISILGLSDLILGGYDQRLMIIVYTMLTLPAILGPSLRQLFRSETLPASPAKALLPLVACSLASSLAFFLVTNFACWMLFEHYERSWSGLTHCFSMALPFFRYTIAGDLTFAFLTFGIYLFAISSRAKSTSTDRLCPVNLD